MSFFKSLKSDMQNFDWDKSPFQLKLLLLSAVVITIIDIILIVINAELPLKGYSFTSFNIVIIYFVFRLCILKSKKIKNILLLLCAINLIFGIFEMFFQKEALSGVMIAIGAFWFILVPLIWMILLYSTPTLQ